MQSGTSQNPHSQFNTSRSKDLQHCMENADLSSHNYEKSKTINKKYSNLLNQLHPFKNEDTCKRYSKNQEVKSQSCHSLKSADHGAANNPSSKHSNLKNSDSAVLSMKISNISKVRSSDELKRKDLCNLSFSKEHDVVRQKENVKPSSSKTITGFKESQKEKSLGMSNEQQKQTKCQTSRTVFLHSNTGMNEDQGITHHANHFNKGNAHFRAKGPISLSDTTGKRQNCTNFEMRYVQQKNKFSQSKGNLNLQDRDARSLKEKTFCKLKDILEKGSDEALENLLLPELNFSNWLEGIGNNKESMILSLMIIIKGSKSSDRGKAVAFLADVFQNKCYVSHSLNLYLSWLYENNLGSPHDYLAKELFNIFIFFHQNHPALAVKTLRVAYPMLEETCKKISKEEIKDINTLVEKLGITEHENKYSPGKFSKLDSSELTTCQSSKNFRLIDVFPSLDNLQLDISVLRPNIVIGSYENVEHYLDLQFHLLREDYIRPLRQGINMYKNSEPLKNREDYEDIRIHENALITERYCNKNGDKMIELSFGKKQFQRIDWQQSKRFTNGSLLFLSPDGFRSLYLASVEERSCSKLRVGKINLKLESLDLYSFAPIVKFVVLETEAFFIAYRYNLSVLQKFSPTGFPMQKYIIQVQKHVENPAYLKCAPRFDFKPLLRTKMVKNVEISNFHNWPTEEELGMNTTQLEAIKGAFNKEFSLIQGPPGTGKTFIGLKIVQLLVHNSYRLCLGPILILCYTNHALDQFLEGISKFTHKIVRIGGGSTNENLDKYKLENMRLHSKRYIPFSISQNITDQVRKLHEIRNKIKCIDANIRSCSRKIIADKHLVRFINSKHMWLFDYLHLCDIKDCIEHWLTFDFEIFSGVEFQDFENEVKKRKDILCKLSLDAMLVEEAISVVNVWELCTNDRWRLYNYWVKQYVEVLLSEVQDLQEILRKESEIYYRMREEQNLYILKSSQIVGMTITGAAKHQSLLSELGPRVVVIEEAAEVLESHIVTSLSSKTEHVILIGDHQQLRPKTNVYELSKIFNMDVSLFERMVNNDVEYHQLTVQHRMRPEISLLLVPHIYPNLTNHRSVEQFEDIKGIKKNMFFVTHENLEAGTIDSKSKTNHFEAEFIVQLCVYLLQQEYNAEQITILTAYLGQKYVIENLIKNKSCSLVKVKVVDNYQGEENDIILLSFVRSNNQGRIGYLATSNRVCVALSRARKGLYCVGNFELFERKSSFWRSVMGCVKKEYSISKSLQIYCQNHSETVTEVSKASDFEAAPDGGCMLPCEFLLPCGHTCKRKCHPYDKAHEKYECLEKCNKVCEKGHLCSLKCYQTCQCLILLEKSFSDCNHTCQIPCHRFQDEVLCKYNLTVKLLCGHQMKYHCCNIKTREDFTLSCTQKCNTRLECGHICKETCAACFNGRLHQACGEPCTRKLICGDACSNTCNEPCGPCQKKNCKNYTWENSKLNFYSSDEFFNFWGSNSNLHKYLLACTYNSLSVNATRAFKSVFQLLSAYKNLFHTCYEQKNDKNAVSTLEIPIYFVDKKFEANEPCMLFEINKQLVSEITIPDAQSFTKEQEVILQGNFFHENLCQKDLISHIDSLRRKNSSLYHSMLNSLSLFLSKKKHHENSTLLRLQAIIYIAVEVFKAEVLYQKCCNSNFVSEVLKNIWKFAQQTRYMIESFCETKYSTASRQEMKQITEETKRYVLLLKVLQISMQEPADDANSKWITHAGMQLSRFEPFDKNMRASLSLCNKKLLKEVDDSFIALLTNPNFNSFVFYDNWQICAFGHICGYKHK